MVANSPGLIAGSNVLHRLLMPRHPPCALHSLSQQRQDNTHKETTPAHPPIKEAGQLKRRNPSGKTGHARTQKSSSLNYSQPTTTQKGLGRLQRCSRPLCRSQTTTPPTPSTTHRAASSKGRTRTTNQPADPSGPNSVPDPIPHQRRAMSNQQSWPSTIPLVNTTMRARTFAWHRGVCSLERR